MTLLTITLELRMILQNIWSRVVGIVLINIFALNFFSNFPVACKIVSKGML